MQIGYHVLLLFEPVVNHVATALIRESGRCHYHSLVVHTCNLRLKHTRAVCMAVRLYFEGRKDNGGSLKGKQVCGAKEKLGRIMDVLLEEEKEQVNGVKYTCFNSYQKHRLHT